MFAKLESYKTSKNEYGKCLYDNKICFYKIKDNILLEINGYNILKNYYNVPKLIYHDDNSIIYKYDDNLINNTIHEYLYYGKKLDIAKVIMPYKKSFSKSIVLDEDKSINKCFFKGRINKLDYEPLKDIITEVKEALQEDKKLTCFYTQGDPTDTNISCNGIYTDFKNAGYNSVIGEIAIMFASFITHGKYFYPKYNSKAYVLHPRIVNDYEKYNPSKKVPENNKKIMLEFLKVFENDKNVLDEIKKYLKYYIIMRMLSPIDINIMDSDDKNVINNYIKKIYNMDFNINSFKEMIIGSEL